MLFCVADDNLDEDDDDDDDHDDGDGSKANIKTNGNNSGPVSKKLKL